MIAQKHCNQISLRFILQCCELLFTGIHNFHHFYKQSQKKFCSDSQSINWSGSNTLYFTWVTTFDPWWLEDNNQQSLSQDQFHFILCKFLVPLLWTLLPLVISLAPVALFNIGSQAKKWRILVQFILCNVFVASCKLLVVPAKNGQIATRILVSAAR